MDVRNKATRINLFSLATPQMRAFHMSWFAFFLCFFAWFGIAPLMAIVREEMGLTKAQIGNTIIASVAITIVARLFIGWACDRFGPRLTYTWLLLLGSLPVMAIGLAHNYTSFLLFRLGIGVIGASFVITQYHTSVMFAPNVVGTANATSAGWGNLGGGVTQMVMPLVFTFFIAMGFATNIGWRLAMVVAGGVCFLTGLAYYFFTQDLPDGNFKELREKGLMPKSDKVKGTFMMAVKDRRVWALFLIYAGCFGVELTINNIAALYYIDYFGLGLKAAGLVAGLFGLMNIFARTTGGIIGDRFGHHGGLKGRVKWLFIALLVESVALITFSRISILPVAIGVMIVFSLFVQMSEGATFSVVPFINKKALGSVAGIVGAGGNMGAVAAGFLFRAEGISWPQALLYLGIAVFVISFATAFVTFTAEDEAKARVEHEAALAERRAAVRGKRIREWKPAFGTIRPMDLLRIYLGIALAIKGIYFILNFGDLEAKVGSITDGMIVVAWFVVLVHAVGGAALAMGFVTRVAAALNIVVLLGANWFLLTSQGMGSLASNDSLQFAMFVLFALVLLFWRGSGRLSMDYLLRYGNLDQQDAAAT